jgi:general secretion pathway protein C
MARRPAPAPFHVTSGADAILARNAFDSTARPFRPRDEAHEEIPAPSTDPSDAPPCAEVRVVGIAASDDPAYSLAVLRTGDRALLRRRGGEVGELRVAHVGRDRVWLAGDQGLCQTALYAPPPEPPVKPVASTPPPETPRPIPVRKKSATEVEVDRSVVEEILRDPTAIQKTTRVVLDQGKDGRVLGLKLLGVTPQTVLGALGFENGDRLESVNGFDVTKPEVALEAYARLREASHLDVKIDRAGRPVTLSIDVR